MSAYVIIISQFRKFTNFDTFRTFISFEILSFSRKHFEVFKLNILEIMGHVNSEFK
jgi:hypothetical protein